MPNLKAEIRGAYFRPPAQQVLAVLPMGSQLRLEPDDENVHDENAVKVLCQTSDIPQGSIDDQTLENFGIDPGAFWAQPEVWVGYVAKEQAPLFRQAFAQGAVPTGTIGLGLNPKGKTVYEVEMEVGP